MALDKNKDVKMTSTGKKLYSKWNSEDQIFYTRISGFIGYDELKIWEREMRQESQKIPENTHFKFLVDEQHYEFENIEVHKVKRNIMPKFLAEFGFTLSVLSAEEKIELDKIISINTKNIQCIAVAMVHHDEIKMKSLQDEFGQSNEKYLSNLGLANNWLDTIID